MIELAPLQQHHRLYQRDRSNGKREKSLYHENNSNKKHQKLVHEVQKVDHLFKTFISDQLFCDTSYVSKEEKQKEMYVLYQKVT